MTGVSWSRRRFQRQWRQGDQDHRREDYLKKHGCLGEAVPRSKFGKFRSARYEKSKDAASKNSQPHSGPYVMYSFLTGAPFFATAKGGGQTIKSTRQHIKRSRYRKYLLFLVRTADPTLLRVRVISIQIDDWYRSCNLLVRKRPAFYEIARSLTVASRFAVSLFAIHHSPFGRFLTGAVRIHYSLTEAFLLTRAPSRLHLSN